MCILISTVSQGLQGQSPPVTFRSAIAESERLDGVGLHSIAVDRSTLPLLLVLGTYMRRKHSDQQEQGEGCLRDKPFCWRSHCP